MSSFIPLILKVSLLTFLISGMLGLGLLLLACAAMVPASAWLRRQAPQSPTLQPHATPS